MNLLIIEDNKRIATSLEQGLTESGYSVRAVHNGSEALKAMAEQAVDLVVLDLGLPDIHGLDLLPQLKKNKPALPVIILTARGEVEDRVIGLEAGADDYIVKPFAFSELVARIRAIERRESRGIPDRITIRDLELNLIKRSAARSGEAIDLTPREFDLLLFLARNLSQPVSREMIAREVWDITSRAVPFDNIIDVHISNLRKKIDANREYKLIHTIRGVGFAMGEEK